MWWWCVDGFGLRGMVECVCLFGGVAVVEYLNGVWVGFFVSLTVSVVSIAVCVTASWKSMGVCIAVRLT